MNVGHAFTASMRDQRKRDLLAIRRGIKDVSLGDRFDAWLWWGWALEKGGRSLGVGGATYPYWTEPRWLH